VSLSELEFAALRSAIAVRSTARVSLLPVTLIGWGLIMVLSDRSATPLPGLVALAILAGGFEAIHALHVGAERIGRYLQVFYEQGAGVPRWETTAMAVGPALPGGGIDPLFTTVFLAVTLLNLVPVLASGAAVLAVALAVALHAGFAYRVVRARGAAARQRAVELESFKALRDSQLERR
jgi:hypothetical protein